MEISAGEELNHFAEHVKDEFQRIIVSGAEYIIKDALLRTDLEGLALAGELGISGEHGERVAGHIELGDNFNIVVVGICRGLKAAAYAHIYGAGEVYAGLNSFAGFYAVRGADNRHVGYGPHNGEVLGAVVGGAGVAEGYAGVGGYYLYRQILVSYVRAHHAGEYGHG